MMDVQSMPLTSLDLKAQNIKAKTLKNKDFGEGFKNELNTFKERLRDDKPPEVKSSREGFELKKVKTRNQNQQPMLSFMDSMESELGVTPDRLLAAWAMMKPGELAQSPEETSQQFVENLNLPPTSQGKALELYNEMLLKNKLTENESGFLLTHFDSQKAIPTQLMQSKQRLIEANSLLPNQFLIKNVNEVPQQNKLLNQQFDFVGDAPIPFNTDEINAYDAKLQDTSTHEPSIQDDGNQEFIESEFVTGEDPRLESDINIENSKNRDIPRQLTSSQKRQLLNQSIDRMNQRFFMNPLEDQNKRLSTQSVDSPFAPNTKEVFNESGWLANNQRWVTNDNQMEANLPKGLTGEESFIKVLPSTQSLSNEGGQAKDFSSDLSQQEEKSEFEDSVYNKLMHEWKAPSPSGKTSESANASFMNGQMSAAEKVQNVAKVMEQARVLTNAGGGEVRVKLSPEGMGDVHLKVIVQNGKVALEMKAQNKDVQKLLETHLEDLKTNLAEHRLHVDKVQVDVSSQDSLTSQDQFLKNMEQHQQWSDARDQARQFMGGFREGNFFQRQNMMETPQLDRYQPRQGVELEPVTEKGRARPRQAQEGVGSALNLVA